MEEEKEERPVNHVYDVDIISFDIAQKDVYELDLQGKFKVVPREGKYYVERIKPNYPKTYEECCGVLGMTYDYPDIRMVSIVESNLYSSFIQLIRCRDAYWKIAGKQMGLEKPWKPGWTNPSERKYCITTTEGNITKLSQKTINKILAFPTEEIRDMFYENFKDLIEACKEFL